MSAASKHISGPARPDHWVSRATCPPPHCLVGLAGMRSPPRLGTKKKPWVPGKHDESSRRGPSNARSRASSPARATRRVRTAASGSQSRNTAPRTADLVFLLRGLGIYFPDRQEGPWVRDIVCTIDLPGARWERVRRGLLLINQPALSAREMGGGYEAIAISMRHSQDRGPRPIIRYKQGDERERCGRASTAS